MQEGWGQTHSFAQEGSKLVCWGNGRWSGGGSWQQVRDDQDNNLKVKTTNYSNPEPRSVGHFHIFLFFIGFRSKSNNCGIESSCMFGKQTCDLNYIQCILA